MTTEAIKYELFPMCLWGWHSKCIGRHASVLTIDFVQMPAKRCSCECGHLAQQERDVK